MRDEFEDSDETYLDIDHENIDWLEKFPKYHARASTSLLENLPPELRLKLFLLLPDLATLQSLALASPVYYLQYQHDRKVIIRSYLAGEISGYFVDVYATFESRVFAIGQPPTDEKVFEFCGSYSAWLAGSCPSLDRLDFSAVWWMWKFHLSVVRPLARKCAASAFSRLCDRLNAERSSNAMRIDQGALNLSSVEETRICRALYRVETFHHLFGRDSTTRHRDFRRHHLINRHFLCLFEPWQVEQIDCIDAFMRLKYHDIFTQVKADLDRNPPRFLQRDWSRNARGAVNLEWEIYKYINGTVLRGLRLFARFVDITDHEELLVKMESWVAGHQNSDNTLENSMALMAQSDRYDDVPRIERDEAQQQEDSLTFPGDADPDGPPLGWVLVWGGQRCNLYGGLIPEALKPWGYVFWDESRWDQLGNGARQMIPWQWKKCPIMASAIENVFHVTPPRTNIDRPDFS